MGRDCASERVPIALAEGRPEDPRAKASAEIDVAAVTVEGSRQKHLNREISRAVPMRVAAQVSHPSVSCAKFEGRRLRAVVFHFEL